MEAHFGAIWEAIADATPDAPAVVQGARRISWRDYETRAARLAQALLDAGLGPHAKVGMYLYNSPEYCETNFAAMKIRGVPINVNYRYLDDELAYLIDNADMEALVFHSSLGDRVANVRSRAPGLKLLVEVEDGPAADGSTRVADAVGYETIQRTLAPAARITPQGDEIYMFYTGGTTGMPKGVMYSMRDFAGFFLRTYPAMIGQPSIADPTRLPDDRAGAPGTRRGHRQHVRPAADARDRLLARHDGAADARRHRGAAREPLARPSRALVGGRARARQFGGGRR